MTMRKESGTTLRRDLTEASWEYADRLAQQGFIGLKVAPLHEVGEMSASYPVMKVENFVTIEETARNNQGKYNEADGEFGSGSYSCEDRGLQGNLSDANVRQYASFLDLEMAKTRVLTHKVLLAQEKRISDLVMDSSTFTYNSADTTWATAASATPLADIETGMDTIHQKTGIPKEMMTVILGSTDFTLLCKCDEVIDQVKYTYSGDQGVRPSRLKPMHIATILQCKQVLVGFSGYNSKVEGETMSVSGVWPDDYCMVAVIADEGAPLEEPSAFRTMLWTPDSPQNPVVERWYSDDYRGQRIRVRHNVDEVATAEADLLTYLINTTP